MEDIVEPLRSVHTSNLPDLLDQFGMSVLVTTYQAGRLVVLRSQHGTLNTHFRTFDKPMGLAVCANRIAVGGATSVWEFHNLPAVCHRLDNSNAEHDACYLPRTTHWTSDIQIHEMAWCGSNDRPDLLFVNTLFSCVAQRSDIYNFVPVWRPPFIKQFAPQDSCHLNGIATREGRARYVSALGEADRAGGWRENKRDGGIVIDMESDEIIARQLSMPHSPRWYRDRLWILESGRGGFGYIDLDTGKYQAVTELPGFTRGLSFVGPLALIGLSQVRESAVFGGVPIAERELAQRNCGVWVVDLESGNTVGFVRFEDAVQEIFAVESLPSRYPEIVNENRELLAGSFELPNDVVLDVPESMRSKSKE